MGFVLENDPNEMGPTVALEMIPVILAQAKERPKLATQISLGLVALVLAARWLRLYLRDRGRVRVTYAGRRPATIVSDTGLTLLEMVHANNLPHANVCRGRGRCGTCRVRVLRGSDSLQPPDAIEAKVLARWNAGPRERLACQIKPQEGELEVERVIQADYSDLDYSKTKRNDTTPEAAS